MPDSVALFIPYPFRIGDKIRITDGPRQGDWRVVDLSAGKMTLECPVSGRRFTWDQFCYFVEERQDEPWPRP